MDPPSSLLSADCAGVAVAAPVRLPRASRLTLAAATAWCRLEALAAVHAERRGHASFTRLVDSVQRVSGAALALALDMEEMSRLTVRLYDFYPAQKAAGDALFDVEAAVFARRLPQAPARILVGACGSGREAVALTAHGHSVEAFDPAPDCVAESSRRLDGRAAVRRLSYEQLSAIVLEGAGGDALCQQRFDAVVLGCGSLSHVLEPIEQRRLMQALHLLCPTGPVIASFLWLDDAADGPPTGRASRLGQLIGRALARLRGVAAMNTRQLSYRARRGFAYTFGRCEVEALARSAGRRVIWEVHAARPTLYASFLPLDSSH